MKIILKTLVVLLLAQTSLFSQPDCFCGGDFTIGTPSDPTCTWSLEVGALIPGGELLTYLYSSEDNANERQTFIALPSPELITVALTADCDDFSLPITYNFCGTVDNTTITLKERLGVEAHFFVITKECDFDCTESACTCEVEYTITNNSELDWFGIFIGEENGIVDDCFEDIAVRAGASATFIGTLDANFPGEDNLQYRVTPLNNSIDFNDPDLAITFTSDCDLNFSIDPSIGSARFIPENSGCIPPCPAYDFQIETTVACSSFPQLCSICYDGGVVCVRTTDGLPLPTGATATFFSTQNPPITSDDGCISVSGMQARYLSFVRVTIDGCEYDIPIVFEDDLCELFEGGGQGTSTSDEISVFPNPAQDQLKIANPGAENYSAQLQSIDGKLIETIQLNAYQTKDIHVAKMPEGIYFLKITNPKSKELIHTEKVIIAH